MTISKYQEEKIRGRVVRQMVVAGEPFDQAVADRRADRAMKNAHLGVPAFVSPLIEAGGTTPKAELERAWRNIQDDLETARAKLAQHENYLHAVSELHATGSTALQQGSEMLHGRILAAGRGTRSPVFTETFVNFNHLEFSGSPHGNLAATTCHVDLEHGMATCRPYARHQGKIPLAGAKVGYRLLPGTSQEKARLTCHGLPEAIITEDDAYWFVEANIIDDAVTLEVEIKLPEPRQMNLVRLVGATGLGQIELAADGVLIPPVASGKPVWHFAPQKVSVLTWRFTKNLPEETGKERRFYFGLREAEVYLMRYETSGVLVTKPIFLPGTRMRVTTRQFAPPGTALRYYYGVEAPGTAIRWSEVKPGEEVVVKSLVNNTDSWIPTDAGYGEEVLSGLYQIGILENEPYFDSLEIRFGESMWRVERAPVPQEIPENWEPGLDDWLISRPQDLSFLALEAPQFDLEPGYLYRFVTWVNVPEPVVERWLPVFPGVTATLWLNSRPVQRLNDATFSIPLSAGQNRLELFTVAPTLSPMDPRFYVGETVARVAASPAPMSIITAPALAYNYSGPEVGLCALHGRQVLVNYNPLGLGGVRYTYRYYTAFGEQVHVRLMVVAGSTDDTVTPCLTWCAVASR